ncbi:Hypothetical predicted protein [Cloeon dipterum]|uniref:Uncharacterized protein n=1 Tax=Cloeon dipterum TaxID=197152 RepID=A0A8S1C6Y8_9INSE|nr:Hypothetical predicted protein [Cloeon dipterum]
MKDLRLWPMTLMGLVFLGCCSNVYFLELLVKEDPGIGIFATFSQFLFIALHGFVSSARCGTRKPQIHVKHYVLLVIFFFVANVSNNYAFNFNIAMPLHIIIRSGSLIANMVMGIIILKRAYSNYKVASVLTITIGVVICTLESAKVVTKNTAAHKKSTSTDDPDPELAEPTASDPNTEFLWWCVGVALLVVALFVSARMGIYQETLFKAHGKHSEEAVFYTHLMPLPGFIFLYSNIFTHMTLAVESPPISVLGVIVPCTLVYLALNVLSQFICISSVYALTTECTSLTVTLVVTLRKFLSLVFSIWYFQNPFTAYHWLGTLLIFGGTIGFSLS